MARLLVIDNYDSFTYNLVQMFKIHDLEIIVKRSDCVSLKEAEGISPDYILISPGPKSPSHTGISIPLIKKFFESIPILGVCLGMQCINEAFGGKTVRADVPVHGKISEVSHSGSGIFKEIPDKISVARYHSLAVERKNGVLVETAHSDGVVMALEHREYPLFGVQFHPESFMTEFGDIMIKNFLDTGVLKV